MIENNYTKNIDKLKDKYKKKYNFTEVLYKESLTQDNITLKSALYKELQLISNFLYDLEIAKYNV